MNVCDRCGTMLEYGTQVYFDKQPAQTLRFCEACGPVIEKQRQACGHDQGRQQQHYDADGVGYRTWHCDNCEWWEFDQ